MNKACLIFSDWWRTGKGKNGTSLLGITRRNGSTLIEVIISIAVVVLVLVSITASGTLVTRNRRFSAQQASATKYSQEAVDWAKNLRNTMGWLTFYDEVSGKGVSPIVCLETLTTTPAEFSAVSAGACQSTQVIAGTDFVRSVQFTILSSTEVRAESSVTWVDNQITHEARAEVILQEWQ